MKVIFDQYTPALMGSTELKDALALFGNALAGKEGAERIDVGRELVEDARRKRIGYVEALDAIDARRSSPDYRNEVAIGRRGAPDLDWRDEVAIGGDCCPPGPNTTPACTVDGRRLCDYDRVGNRTLAFAGQTTFTLAPSPAAGFAWWKPKLVRGFAHDNTNPSIPRWEGLFITLITIGAHPVEGYSTPPAAGVVSGVHFGDYVTPDNTGIPVGWPRFSNAAQENALSIQGFSLWGAAISTIAYFSVMGNPLNENGKECRVNGNSNPLPPIPSSTGSYTTGSRPM